MDPATSAARRAVMAAVGCLASGDPSAARPGVREWVGFRGARLALVVLVTG
ncbi:MAG: hypothetical protein ACRDTG_29130 [Pseudonocardiaceae bacterium]